MVLLKQTFFSLVALLVVLSPAQSQDAKGKSVSRPISSGSYEDSTEGLQLQLQDILAAARENNQPKLELLIEQMEIPNHERWFTDNFGQEKGESWAGPYGRDLVKNEQEFQEAFLQFA